MTLQRKISIISFVIFSFLSLYFLANSSLFTYKSVEVSKAITFDVLLTIPLVYFLLIRKTSIPKTSVIPVLFIGVVIASYIVPEKNQGLLNVFKTWIIPLIELSVFTFIVLNIIKARKEYKNNSISNSDFFTILKQTCNTILPRKIAPLFVTEISVFYYGFFYWRKQKLSKNEFTYYKESGSVTLLVVFIFLIAVETLAFHLLLSSWNETVAWVLTGISIYSGVQIFGFLKSMLKRPIVITDTQLLLRYGIMKETIIDIEDISAIELSSKNFEPNENILRLSLLGSLESHNVIISLNKENYITGLYGNKKTYKKIAASIDEVTRFKSLLELANKNITNP